MVLSNRFYRDYDTTVQRSRAAELAGRSEPGPRETARSAVGAK
jgi:hypothetical protein